MVFNGNIEHSFVEYGVYWNPGSNDPLIGDYGVVASVAIDMMVAKMNDFPNAQLIQRTVTWGKWKAISHNI